MLWLLGQSRGNVDLLVAQKIATDISPSGTGVQPKREVVLVENPTWTQRETTIVMNVSGGVPIVVLHNFGCGPVTVCKLASNGVVISCADALEGAKYGWYECRLLGTCSSGQCVQSAERVARYSHDGTVGVALGVAGLFTVFALVFGK